MTHGPRLAAALRHESWAWGSAAFAVLIVIWWGVALAGVFNERLLPAPPDVLRAFTEMLASGEWFRDLGSSLGRYGAGFVLGNVLGVILGVTTGHVRIARLTLGAVLNFARSTPTIVLIPVAMVWLGIGEVAKILVVTWGVLFPVWLNTHMGLGTVRKEYVWVAQSLGATRAQLYRHVYLPHTLRYIVTGSRMAVATGFFALAATEAVGAFSGIAFRAFFAYQTFRTDRMFVAILTITSVAFVIDRLFVWVVRQSVPWWRNDQAEV
jgi:ABC-type nitrate/sulfonate/bicarbonate transport system permease component